MAQTPRKIRIDASARPKVEAPLWAKITGLLIVAVVLATVGIPLAWGLTWLVSNWP